LKDKKIKVAEQYGDFVFVYLCLPSILASFFASFFLAFFFGTNKKFNGFDVSTKICTRWLFAYTAFFFHLIYPPFFSFCSC